MGIYEEIKGILDGSSNRFENALKMAATGNIIDFGPSHEFSQESLIVMFISILRITCFGN